MKFQYKAEAKNIKVKLSEIKAQNDFYLVVDYLLQGNVDRAFISVFEKKIKHLF